MQRALKIIRWIFGIILALLITVGIVIVFFKLTEQFSVLRNYSSATRISNLMVMLIACTCFVVLSSLFVLPPKKFGMLFATAFIITLRILLAYFCVTQPTLYGQVDYYAIIISLLGTGLGVFISYSILKNKEWDSPAKKDEAPPLSY